MRHIVKLDMTDQAATMKWLMKVVLDMEKKWLKEEEEMTTFSAQEVEVTKGIQFVLFNVFTDVFGHFGTKCLVVINGPLEDLAVEEATRCLGIMFSENFVGN